MLWETVSNLANFGGNFLLRIAFYLLATVVTLFFRGKKMVVRNYCMSDNKNVFSYVQRGGSDLFGKTHREH